MRQFIAHLKAYYMYIVKLQTIFSFTQVVVVLEWGCFLVNVRSILSFLFHVVHFGCSYVENVE